MQSSWLLNSFREHELHRALETLGSVAGFDLLEIGGGNGFQAQLLNKLSANVTSIDVCEWQHGERLFPVTLYDGVNIPFSDSSFDMVFSSNVLEHVKDIDAILLEMRRVLRPGGIAVHILPSVSWRFWSIFTHYLFVIRRLLGQLKLGDSETDSSDANRATYQRRGLIWMIRNTLIAPAHGEFRNALVELFEYSQNRWCGRFSKNGWRTIAIRPSGLFYTDRLVAQSWGIPRRIEMAKYLGSACIIYIIRSDKLKASRLESQVCS